MVERPDAEDLTTVLAQRVTAMRQAAENLQDAEREYRSARSAHDSAVRLVRDARKALDIALADAGLPEEPVPQPVAESLG